MIGGGFRAMGLCGAGSCAGATKISQARARSIQEGLVRCLVRCCVGAVVGCNG